jgi:branched-chain amino acid transport system ATP-binding protein
VLNVQRLNTYYGDMQALFDISVDLKEGEIVAIVGSNGGGKSTLINAISGVIDCASGIIEFDGKRVEKCAPHERVELGIVQIPEGRRIFPRMTVGENLDLGAYTKHARSVKDGNLRMVFEIFPILLEREEQIAGFLSGGEQQMLAIARGLMSAPRLLMLDEPSLGLAPKLVKAVFEIVQTINRRMITVCLVEQNVSLSLAISGRAYVLENGRIAVQGNGPELLNNEHVKKAYLGL